MKTYWFLALIFLLPVLFFAWLLNLYYGCGWFDDVYAINDHCKLVCSGYYGRPQKYACAAFDQFDDLKIVIPGREIELKSLTFDMLVKAYGAQNYNQEFPLDKGFFVGNVGFLFKDDKLCRIIIDDVTADSFIGFRNGLTVPEILTANNQSLRSVYSLDVAAIKSWRAQCRPRHYYLNFSF